MINPMVTVPDSSDLEGLVENTIKQIWSIHRNDLIHEFVIRPSHWKIEIERGRPRLKEFEIRVRDGYQDVLQWVRTNSIVIRPELVDLREVVEGLIDRLTIEGLRMNRIQENEIEVELMGWFDRWFDSHQKEILHKCHDLVEESLERTSREGQTRSV